MKRHRSTSARIPGRLAAVLAVALVGAVLGCATAGPPPPTYASPEPEIAIESEGVDAVTEGLSPLPTPVPVAPRKPAEPRPRAVVAVAVVDPVQDVLARLEKAVATCSGVVSAAGSAAAAATAVANPPEPKSKRRKARPARPPRAHSNAPLVRKMIEDTTSEVRVIQKMVDAPGWTEDGNEVADLGRRTAALEFSCVRLLQSLSTM